MGKREISMVVDVETAGGFGCPLVYDLGITIIERATGRIIKKHSLIIEEVFFGMPEKMRTAYYAVKVPTYKSGIKKGEHRVVSWWEAWRIVKNAVAYYGIKRVYAYNAGFDQGALNSTMRTLTHGKTFLPKTVKVCCIWHMACQTILRQARFRKFATAHGLVSEAGNFRTSAEAAHAYLTNNPTFEESHTGLDDAIIESGILAAILRQKKRVDESIAHMPWKLAQVA